MPRVVHFEIHADDPSRAAAFYEEVFDWKSAKWDGPHEYWLVTTGPEDQPGINGGIFPRMPGQGGDAVIAYVCTIDVPSVAEYSEKVTGAGGTIVVPKMPVPGVGWLAYCKDTEGNIFGMMEKDPAAAPPA